MRRAVPALLAALVLAGCVSTSSPPLAPAALPVPGLEALTDHAAMVQRLDALRPLGVIVEPIGRSVEGRDLHLVRVGHGPFELWLAARHHGNEVTSTDAVLNVLDYLLGLRTPGPVAFPVTRELAEHRAWLLERVTFVIVPMVNPDGAAGDRRTNANGQDLNRDYLLFTEPEPRAVRDAFWRVWPDAGLDLHNEGLGEQYDYDAYYPEVPRAESDTQELSLENQWLTVHELEASGSYAGGPNENYISSRTTDPCQYLHRYVPDPLPTSVPVPPPTGETDPTAYCEGTHDAFLTLRGAPGWTPEAALAYEEGGHAPPASWPWGIAQHEATIASTAFYYAGAYRACAPHVQKFAGSVAGAADVPITTQGPARFQLVWREDAALDQNARELDLVLRLPDGGTVGPEQHPLGYTETLRSEAAGEHVATVAAPGPLPVAYELRVHACAPHGAALEVAREAAGLRVRNAGALPLQAHVQDSLRGADEVRAEGARIGVVQGALAPKTTVAWDFVLAPGEGRLLAYEAPGAQPGPARWHAHGPAGELLLGVTEERGSPAS